MNLQPSWTVERVDQLIRLTRTNLSAAEIGKKMGVTRNSVIGKLYRINVPLGNPQGYNNASARTTNRNKNKRIASTESRAVSARRKSINIAMDAMKGLPPDQSPFACTIQELGSITEMNRCRFVLDEPTATAKYCGAPSEGPWCLWHRRRVYNKPVIRGIPYVDRRHG